MTKGQIPLRQDADVTFITEVSNTQRNIDHLPVKRHGHNTRRNLHELTRSQSQEAIRLYVNCTSKISISHSSEN